MQQMVVLHENHQRARKARMVMTGAVIWSLGWLFWAYYFANAFGVVPAESSTLRPANQRYLIAILLLIVGFGPLIGLVFYSRSYLTRVERDEHVAVLTTLGILKPREYIVPLDRISRVINYMTEPGGQPAAYMTLRVKDRWLPFMVDMHGERTDMAGIEALAARDTPAQTSISTT